MPGVRWLRAQRAHSGWPVEECERGEGEQGKVRTGQWEMRDARREMRDARQGFGQEIEV